MTHSKRKTLFVHLGTEKTGTTSVQSVLTRHEATVRAAGVSYIKAFRRGVCHNSLTRMMRDDHNDDLIREKISREMRYTQQKNLLISTETAFGKYSTKKMINVFQGIESLEIKPFFYFRRQDLFLESLAKQRGKTGNLAGDYLPFILARREKADYADFLRSMRRQFQDINWAAHLYDRAHLRQQDAVSDLFHQIGLDRLAVAKDTKMTANRTPSLPFIAALSECAFSDPSERRALLRCAMDQSPAAFFKSGDVLTAEQREELMDGYRDCNAYMSEEVGVDLTKLFHDDVSWAGASHAITDPEEWAWAVQAARLEIERLTRMVRHASAA
ncbi:hypothetical protein [Celeribacter sp.]|uniref:hypothetical protein n=1 Tax=Celeribacter sp. TaxID=1890673 RepID=UPI003A951404